MAGYFLNPNTGFTPSQQPQSPLQGWNPPRVQGPSQGGPQSPLQGWNPSQLPTVKTPWQSPQTSSPSVSQSQAVRPTDQGGPQQAWMQNLASYAGGNLAGSTALGNQPTGPVRRLVDVLGQNPFGEQNPMTLLMQALQSSNFGMPLPQAPAPTTTTQPTYNPVWGGPSRPVGFDPRYMYNMP